MACPAPEVLARLGSDACSPEERGDVLDHAATCAICHAAVALLLSAPDGGASADSAARRVGRYELVRVLGRGAMGVVFQARDPELGRDVAIKLLRPGASVDRLRAEARALARLAHPNVVRVYDVVEHEGKAFIAMELVAGQNLRQWLATPRPLEAILAVALQAGKGLAAAHRAGLVHRDFKPDNVLLAEDGQVLVGDFGLARDAGQERTAHDGDLDALAPTTLTETGMLVGTPAYMPPEQLDGEATPASDQFAFAVTIWEACHGVRPFGGTSTGELAENVARGEFREGEGKDVPAYLERALRQGLAADPAARFPSMDALLAALTPRRRRWPWVAGAAAIAAIAVGFAMRPAPEPSCDRAADRMAETWNQEVASRITRSASPMTAVALARYADSWRTLRIEVCRQRPDLSAATFERRVACLDEAQSALHTAVSVVAGAEEERFSRPDAVVEALPLLSRCTSNVGQAPPIAAGLDVVAAAAEKQLIELEMRFRIGSTGVMRQEAIVARALALSAGDHQLAQRARILEAVLLEQLGDGAAAEETLQAIGSEAEAAADDLTRAHAWALLASMLGKRRAPEAADALTRAKAAATRAGPDEEIELILVEAEIAIAAARGDHQAALAHAETRMQLLRARYGDGSPAIVSAYSDLARLAFNAGDHEKHAEATRTAFALAAVRLAFLGLGLESSELIVRDATTLLIRGDFQGAIDLGEAQVAHLRQNRIYPASIECITVTGLGLAYELDGQYERTLPLYLDAERCWNGPESDFMRGGQRYDAAQVLGGRADAHMNLGAVLTKLGRHAEAADALRRCVALSQTSPDTLGRVHRDCSRMLGAALANLGDYRGAKELLEPLASSLVPDDVKPLPRASFRFALARALWHAGGLEDRPRAEALIADAEVDIQAAIADGEKLPYLRRLPARARELRAEIEDWRRKR